MTTRPGMVISGSSTIGLIAPKLLLGIAPSVKAQVIATVLASPQAQPEARTTAPPIPLRTQRKVTARADHGRLISGLRRDMGSAGSA
jgi:hypothetical protein